MMFEGMISMMLSLKTKFVKIFSRLHHNDPVKQEFSMTPNIKLNFDPEASVALCVGIDEQYNSQFPHGKKHLI